MTDEPLTVGDILDEMDGVKPAQPKAAAPYQPKVLPDTPPLPAPGIYFGMPEELYHALPALSASGIKDFAASPMLFWAKCQWLSEDARKREAEAAAEAKEKAHRVIGKAYHCRILEGAEAYAQRFAVELSAEDCAGALEHTDQIKAAINAAGVKPFSKVEDALPDGTVYMRSAVKADWEQQLLSIDPHAKLLSALRSQHAKANAGKALISFDAHGQIEIAARMIEADPNARHAVTGGYPEVVLIWHCAETGVPMKARVDRLKLKAAVDLKTIGNEAGMSLDRAIFRAIANYKYAIQPAVYIEGIVAVRQLVRDKGGPAAFRLMWECDETGLNADRPAAADWVDKWAAETETPEWWWLFQQKGIAPITRLKRLPLGGSTLAITNERVREVKRKWRAASEQYGTAPWLDLAPAEDINDDDLPPYVCDI